MQFLIFYKFTFLLHKTKMLNIKKNLITFIFWTVFGLFLWLNFQANDGKLNAFVQTCAIIVTSYFFTSFLTSKRLPKALRSKKMTGFFVEVGISIFLLSIIFALIYTYINVGNRFRLPHGFTNQLPLLLQGFYLSIPASLLINGAACGIKFYDEHAKIEREHIMLKQAHLESQLKLLQDQINPHVVFNILNHIHILMKNDTQLASFLLLKFSEILRYQLYHCNQNTVMLEKEVQYLQDLVEVEKLRWGQELEVNTEWRLENKKSPIAPLLLVSFIENAFKYVCRLPRHRGYIIIRCIEENQILTLYVENSYSSFANAGQQTRSQGIGLENVKKRLELQYPNNYELKIEPENNVFKVFLNLSNENDY